MKYLAIILLLMIIPSTSAAIIQGKIYDLELNRVDNVVVEVDTIPTQRVISKYGEYFFNVPHGNYTITASALLNDQVYLVNENISVISDGDFSLDLFLFPELESIKEFPEIKDNSNLIVYSIMGIIFLGLLFILYRMYKKKRISSENDEEVNKIYNLIKSHKRVTQKEIRNASPLSESKISLIISELENEGKIRKIKRGRANIIILNKNK